MAEPRSNPEHPVKRLLNALLGMMIEPGLLNCIESFAKRRRLILAYISSVELLRAQSERETKKGGDSGSSAALETLRKYESRSARFQDNPDVRAFILQEIQSRLRNCATARQALCDGGGLILDAIKNAQSLERTHGIMTWIERSETSLLDLQDRISRQELGIEERAIADLWAMDSWIATICPEIFAAVELGNAEMLASLSDSLDSWRQQMSDLHLNDLRPATWFNKASDGGLYPDLLRVAVHEHRLLKSKMLGGRWRHSIAEVCMLYPGYRSLIFKAKET
jgi:hypothetical protein